MTKFIKYTFDGFYYMKNNRWIQVSDMVLWKTNLLNKNNMHKCFMTVAMTKKNPGTHNIHTIFPILTCDNVINVKCRNTVESVNKRHLESSKNT